MPEGLTFTAAARFDMRNSFVKDGLQKVNTSPMTRLMTDAPAPGSVYTHSVDRRSVRQAGE
jgi:hypothetical protein